MFILLEGLFRPSLQSNLCKRASNYRSGRSAQNAATNTSRPKQKRLHMLLQAILLTFFHVHASGPPTELVDCTHVICNTPITFTRQPATTLRQHWHFIPNMQSWDFIS